MNEELLEVVHGRQNPGIDPTLTIWGWEIPVYLFLGGVAAGILVLVALAELTWKERPASRALRLMPFAALGLISLGMGALFLDLSHKLHVLRFYLAFRPSSPMSWGAWILLLVYPAGVLHGLGSLLQTEREVLLSRAGVLRGLLAWLFTLADDLRRQVLWLSLGVGAGLGVYTGLLLGTLVARLQWNSPVLGPLFLASGISTGAAFILLFPLDHQERSRLTRWDVAAIAAELLLLAVMLVGFATGSEAGQVAAVNLLGGAWTAPFWSLVIVTGLIVPLSLELLELRRQLAFTLLAPALILLGGLALRAILVGAGLETAFHLLS